MPILSKPASAAYMSLVYITLGALLVVWTAVWFLYLHNTNYTGPAFYWCIGLCLSGLTLMVIGFGVGEIGRAARHAELPPAEVTNAEIKSEQLAASRAPVAMPVNGNVPLGTPMNGALPVNPALPVSPVAAMATGTAPPVAHAPQTPSVR